MNPMNPTGEHPMYGTQFNLTREDQIPHLTNQITQMLSEHGPVVVHYMPPGAKRSLDQNSLLSVWVRDICRQLNERTGEPQSEDLMKTYLKNLLGLKKTGTIAGNEVTMLKSTVDYSVEEMSAFLLAIDIYCADRRIILTADPTYQQYKEASL